MIRKERKKSLTLRKLEALMRRLPSNHPKKLLIEENVAKYATGFRGEQTVDYYLQFLPAGDTFIFHDIRLPNAPHFFQIDTLLVSLNFILIIEVKNIAGTIYFEDQFDQMIRTIDNKENGFGNPLLQVARQQEQLKEWLHAHVIPPVPIESLVVISNPSTIIKASSKHPVFSQKIIHAAKLIKRIEAFERTHTQEKLTRTDQRRLSKLLLRKDTSFAPDMLGRYGIRKEELLKGVHCPKCFTVPMEKKSRSYYWVCHACQHTSKEAPEIALNDYFLLLRPTITNKQLRDFLNIESRSISMNLLLSMKLKPFGEGKSRIYHFPANDKK